MKFDVFNRFSGNVQFTAEIDCDENASNSIKLGLAVQWAFKSKASLNRASLDGASLIGASLDGASLIGASLNRASLDGASLIGASLDGASLIGASLDGARLIGASLIRASLDGASLIGASLIGASLIGASLDGARLIGASLIRASLDGASLIGASLDGASLIGASLDGARLIGASGLHSQRVTPLYMLFDQPGKIRAYKVVTKERTGIYYPDIVYSDGAAITVDDANTDPSICCGKGINVATLDWCLAEWNEDRIILTIEFEATDIATIPYGANKFRLHKCTVIGEKVLDYKALGLIK